MVRYAGICAPAAVVLWFFFRGQKQLRQRFVDAGKAALVPVIGFGGWLIRSARVPDGQGGAGIAPYGHFGATLREGAQTIADWLAPGIESPSLQAIVAISVVVAITVIVVTAWRRIAAQSRVGRSAGALLLLRADILLLSCYVAILLSARLLVGDAIPFDFRLLAPAVLLAEVGIAVALMSFLGGATRPIQATVIALLCLWVVGSIAVSSADAWDSVTIGYDFASTDWRASPTLKWVRTGSAGWTLFTDWPAAVYFHTHRIARDIPASLDTTDLREFGKILRERHGAFVAFTAYNTDYPPPDSIAHALGLVQARNFSDGKVWVSPATEPK